MINENKNKYIPLGLPNVQIEVPVEVGTPDPLPVITSFMAALINPLAMRHPEWRFVASFNTSTVSSFFVYQGKEQLGRISSGWRGYSSTYDITNHRTSKVRMRSDSIQTKDPNKAAKTVEKYFANRSFAEVLAERGGKLRQHVGVIKYNAEAEVSRTLNLLKEPLENMAEAEWGSLYLKLQQFGLKPTVNLETLPEKFLRRKKVNEFVASKPWKVTVHNGKHLVTPDDRHASLFVVDEIPDHLKRNLGLLKLVEDNTFVPDVGFKLNDTTFMVMSDKKEE